MGLDSTNSRAQPRSYLLSGLTSRGMLVPDLSITTFIGASSLLRGEAMSGGGQVHAAAGGFHGVP